MRELDSVPAHDASFGVGQSTSRRSALLRIARLSAVAAPLTIALLAPAAASAQERRRGSPGFPFGFPGQPDGQGQGQGQGGPAPDQGQSGDGFGRLAGRLALTQVSQVNGGTGGSDFSANNPGGDPLSFGALALNPDNRQVFVSLRGAATGVPYDVQFERLQDHGREDLGSVTTDGNGNVDGMAPNALGGSHRVGAFVLIRNGQDQYVTTGL
ncbi:MAG: hypothetical protein JO057_10915 [Chloroflexi bacterium]|nr:hypothetical protein [Chloroflexota bacterium]